MSHNKNRNQLRSILEQYPYRLLSYNENEILIREVPAKKKYINFFSIFGVFCFILFFLFVRNEGLNLMTSTIAILALVFCMYPIHDKLNNKGFLLSISNQTNKILISKFYFKYQIKTLSLNDISNLKTTHSKIEGEYGTHYTHNLVLVNYSGKRKNLISITGTDQEKLRSHMETIAAIISRFIFGDTYVSLVKKVSS